VRRLPLPIKSCTSCSSYKMPYWAKCRYNVDLLIPSSRAACRRLPPACSSAASRRSFSLARGQFVRCRLSSLVPGVIGNHGDREARPAYRNWFAGWLGCRDRACGAQTDDELLLGYRSKPRGHSPRHRSDFNAQEAPESLIFPFPH
jgi:hypothetical protein